MTALLKTWPSPRWSNLRQISGSFILLSALTLFLATACGPDRSQQETAEDDVLSDEGMFLRSALVYFVKGDGETLVGEKRELAPADPSRESLARLLIDELARGPILPDHHPVTPPSLEVTGIFFDDMGGLYFDFVGSSLRDWGWGSSSEFLFVRTIVRTMAVAFPEVRRVIFLIDGARAESIAGHLDARNPFEVAEW